MPVHVGDLEAETVPVKIFSLARDALELGDEKAAQRLEFLIVLAGEPLHAEQLFQFMDLDAAIHQPRTVGPGGDALVQRHVEDREIARDFLQHIHERDEALHGPEFIGDERLLLAGLLEGLEQLETRHAGGNDERLGDEFAERLRCAEGVAGPERLHREEANHVVALPFIHGVIRVAGGGNFQPVRLIGIGDIQPDDPRARRHHFADAPVAQGEHALEKVALRLVKHPGPLALLDERTHVLRRHGRLRLWAESDDAEDAIGECAQEMDHRRCHARDAVHGPGKRERDGEGAVQRDALRHEFAEHHGKHGEDEHHGAERHCIRHARERGHGPEEIRQRAGERRPGIGAGEDADERDADLHGGQKAIGRFREFQRDARPRVALRRELAEARLPRRDERDFGHGEKAVRHEQHEDHDELDRDRAHGEILPGWHVRGPVIAPRAPGTKHDARRVPRRCRSMRGESPCVPVCRGR